MRILVIFHLYYEEQLPWFLDKLSNLEGRDWDLVVTGNSLTPAAKDAIIAFKNDAVLMETDRVGYDIWPFIQAVRAIDLTPYDIVIKLHTKNTSGRSKIHVNSFIMKGFEWRNVLVDAILKDKVRVQKVISIFENDPSAGFVCSAKLYTRIYAPEDSKMLDDELSRIGMQTTERRFCAGTMFAIRASLLEPLKSLDLDSSMFPVKTRTRDGSTLAHVYERVFSLLAPFQGYRVRFSDYDLKTRMVLFFRKYIHSFARQIFSLERRGDHWEKYLTIFGLSFKLDDGPRKEY